MAFYKLSDIDTMAPETVLKEDCKEQTRKILKELDGLQNLLYAERKHSVLVILQGLDASGKDGAIKNVFGKLNPQGVSVNSFKVPTEEEAAHDFLWRVHQHVPSKGSMQVFNRSHYEDVLVTRVYGNCSDKKAKQRFAAINAFEELLQVHNNTVILKFYLHVSANEQQERLKERMTNPAKMWKYNQKDFEEAKQRDKYYKYYEDCFKHCNKPEWKIVPADQNWYKEYIISLTILEKLKALKMKFPTLT
ncbi:PPK2 family polyphosphate kinase [Niabella ginsengisoli]|uniref:Polyphosphate kinase n=1 Tax=Niabella ginsengisoli TaxID=522298 RepID=A0ABS9SES0_9BACT|nr:PPK2 family polyphosphate kinase [Niabella ginsengisoli]MCH5596858.1 polyphosphate kinase [Niabella ginsengisoli]